jgi:hydrogenase/urease accessory protein HupE
VLATGSAIAHEVRPGFLELVADGAAVKVLWKAPMRDGYVLPITPVLPATCRDLAPPSRQAIAASLVERRRLDCGPAGLAGATIAIDGLATTLTDVIVRVDLPGLRETVLLKPAAPSFTVTGERPWTRLAADYFRLGVEHILLGVDHLLFVFGLLLVVANVWLLVKTITAFTVAHSITLALATLSIVKVPAAAVEATIALSIVFLAVEIVHARRGRAGITHRLPWLVAFVFGLLHGFGFAGALAEVGLPQTDIPLALLFFNLGVEAGQLLFIGALVAFYAVARRVGAGDLRRFDGWPAYAIGSVAAFWVFDRMAGML